MEPIKGAIESYKQLSQKYDTYILSTAPWKNSSGWSDKNEWVKKYLGDVAHKRLILSHHKNLNYGHYLIDDRLANGADLFKGEHIYFGSDEFPNWDSRALMTLMGISMSQTIRCYLRVSFNSFSPYLISYNYICSNTFCHALVGT